MLDQNYIRQHPDAVRESIRRRGLSVDFDRFLELDKKRAAEIPEIDRLRGELKGKSAPSATELEELQQKKQRLQERERSFQALEVEWSTLRRSIPNLLHSEVPSGATETDNAELRRVGDPPKFGFSARDHLELGETLGVLDFGRGAKVAGSRFYFLRRAAVELELALIRYAFDLLKTEGFELIDTPDLARNEIFDGVGFSPRGEASNVYNIEGSDLSLIATAEIPLAGLHAGEVLDLAQPLKYAGLSRCFRREAGTYGQESKGLYRVHQFTKVEMFIYCRPDESEPLHQYLLSLEERLFSGLGLAYRVVDVCAGDLGASAYRKFDIEAWMPSREGYGEVTSTSNTTDYQTRRLDTRLAEGGYPHTLNGTAIAVSRALLAILENYQQADGSVRVPEALQAYVDFTEIRR